MTDNTSGVDDDFAAEPVPDEARAKWSSIFFATIGVATALFYMQVTSIIAIRFGSAVALCAIAYASIVSVLIGYAMAKLAIRTGFGISLLARVIMGYRGASLFSLLFGMTTLVYFAAEASIMAAALKGVFRGVPDFIVFPAIAMMMVPLVWFGIRVLARFQLASFVLYAILLFAALLVTHRTAGSGENWLHYLPKNAPPFWVGLLAALGIMNGIVFITGLLTADYARYVRKMDLTMGTWWVGVGFQLACFTLAGLLGLWFSVHNLEANPGLYFVAMLGSWGTVFAIATQLRINLANMYSGSLAFVNMLRQAADVRVSRHVMVLLFGITVGVALVVNLISYLTTAITVIGMFTTCFTVLLLTDIYVVRRKEALSGETLGYRRGTIPDWRFPALLSWVAATAVGGALISGLFGAIGQAWASFAAGLVQIALYIAATVLSRTRLGSKRELADCGLTDHV
jgi:purine-cytosine permease-like protein